MRTVAIAAFFGLVVATGATAQTTDPADKPAPVNQRLENQHDRIQVGVKDDQLTKGEATRLRADDAAIHAEEKVDRKANDGKLTNSERRHLQRQLNQNSRAIYRARHNDKKPKS
jgi:hypothetical protein